MLGKHRLGPRFACLDLPFVLLFSSHLLPKHCLSRLRWSDWSESLVLSMMIQFLKDATCTADQGSKCATILGLLRLSGCKAFTILLDSCYSASRPRFPLRLFLFFFFFFFGKTASDRLGILHSVRSTLTVDSCERLGKSYSFATITNHLPDHGL